MNTEHTNQSRQAANAAFEQWWQRHGLEDPMDDEDRYYITASSWARRGYLAAMQAQLAEPAASESSMQWPQERDVGRIGDMSQVASLRVGLDADSDVYVCIHGEAGSGSVEFCGHGSGGGKSPRTRAALIALMVAMEADNAETPACDWWKAREGDEQKGGA